MRDAQHFVRYQRPDLGHEHNGRWTETVVEVSPAALPAVLDHIARQGWLLLEAR